MSSKKSTGKKNKSGGGGNKSGPNKKQGGNAAKSQQTQQQEDDQSIDAQIAALLNQGNETDEKDKEIMTSCSNEAHAIRDAIKATLEATDATLRAAIGEDGAGDGQNDQEAKERAEIEETLRKKINSLTLELNDVKVDEKEVAELGSSLAAEASNRSTNGTLPTNKPDEAPLPSNDEEKISPDSNSIKSPVEVASDLSPDSEPSSQSKETPTPTPTPANATATPEKVKTTKTKESKKDKGAITIDQVIKSLASGHSDAERLQSLAAEYVKLHDRNRVTENQLRSTTKEKVLLYDGHNRILMAKNRLESVCRELQRQNREIKDSMMEKIREEEQRRKEMASKFQGTLNDFLTLIQENQQRNQLLRTENQDLVGKLKMLMDHYEKWEEHVNKIVKQKDLEVQLVKAKLAKTQLLLDQEKNAYLAEKAQMLGMLTDLQKRSQDFAQNEIKLRQELAMYTGKYEEFQGVLQKSNDMFVNFKSDMEKMSKQVKKLEKETQEWKAKWEAGNKQLLKLSQEKQRRDKELIGALTKVATLEKLCRALQIERNDLRKKLNINETSQTAEDNQENSDQQSTVAQEASLSEDQASNSQEPEQAKEMGTLSCQANEN